MKMGACARGCIKGCIIFPLCIILCTNVSARNESHWYCKRTSDHTQPTADPDMEWIAEYHGVYVDKAHADASVDKVIYLTFDAGYENGNVAKILDVMRDEQVCGAFFILGNLIERNPELVQRMANEGHLVCNHTYTHKSISCMNAQQICNELKRLEDAYKKLTGKPMDSYFRPPEGTFDKDSLKVISDQGYTTVFWSFAYADWDNEKQMSKQDAMKKIMDNLHNGEIMLLHPTSATNAAILRDLIRQLKAMGYRFGSLDELQKSVQ